MYLPEECGKTAASSPKEAQMHRLKTTETMYPKKYTGLPPTPTLTERYVPMAKGTEVTENEIPSALQILNGLSSPTAWTSPMPISWPESSSALELKVFISCLAFPVVPDILKLISGELTGQEHHNHPTSRAEQQLYIIQISPIGSRIELSVTDMSLEMRQLPQM